jgi:cephalosporin-C deacetylase-like acetyl esterase
MPAIIPSPSIQTLSRAGAVRKISSHPLVLLTLALALGTSGAKPLAGTAPLNWEGDIASRLIDAADAFLLEKIDEATETRRKKTAAPSREALKALIGFRDNVRVKNPAIWKGQVIQRNEGYTVRSFRVASFGNVAVEGLLLEPQEIRTTTVYLPDPDSYATCTRPQILAAHGHRVFVPVLIDRATRHRKITNREFLYRSGFALGWHLIACEVQKVSSIIDACGGTEVGVCGDGEGGLIALYAAAIDERVNRAWVIGHFGPREGVWNEPACRNVFGLLNHFGDAEIARLVAPRPLIIDPAPAPGFVVPPGMGGKPGRNPSFTREQVSAEAARAGLKLGDINDFAQKEIDPAGGNPLPTGELARMRSRAFEEIDRHNQGLLVESAAARRRYFSELDNSSADKFKSTIEPYRTRFAMDVIGSFDDQIIAANPRSRLVQETEDLRYYEVVLDVFGGEAGLFTYGILVVPKNIKPGEKRPVVVCQHGLEGRPQSTIGQKDHHYYKAFTSTLAGRGFVTFAPQNLYIFGDRFRTLQFKANAIGRTLFSLMVPQHQQLTDWLGSLNFVDPDRIGFYGLSYGGKSAMRIPPLVSNYCLSICSADFNEWVWKNASTRSNYSYVWTGEYEIFEWNLGGTFNYAEMAALIAPRPFMVERGHFDGVAPDETVAHEYAKVRHLYAAKLGIGGRTEIEWFVGPHTINSRGTFDFLHRHLDWPAP